MSAAQWVLAVASLLLPLGALSGVAALADSFAAGGSVVNVPPQIVGFSLYASRPAGADATCPPGGDADVDRAGWACVAFADGNGWSDVCQAMAGDCAGRGGIGRIVLPLGPQRILEVHDRAGTGEALSLR